jgi:PPOX class probable F420-dependent enzyme
MGGHVVASLAALGRRAVAARLEAEEIIWLTTVSTAGQPQSSPVWFHWDGETFLVLSRPSAGKLANIAHNPRVSLHLNSDEVGDHIVTIEGFAKVGPTLAAMRQVAYLDKYAAGIARLGSDSAGFLADFSSFIEVVPARVRLFISQ